MNAPRLTLSLLDFPSLTQLSLTQLLLIPLLLSLLLLTPKVSIADPSNNIAHSGFSHLSTKHGLSQNSIQTIFQDSAGFLWFGTQEGLNQYDGREIKVFRHFASDPTSLSHDVIRDIAQDSRGFLWIATSGGLNQLDITLNGFKRVEILNQKQQPVLRLNRIVFDSQDTLWVATDGDGVFYALADEDYRNFYPYTLIPQLSEEDIRDIAEDSRGRMWFGTDGQGLFLVEQGDIRHFDADQQQISALSNNRVRDIFEDSNGKVWIATRGGGVNYFNEMSQSFRSFQHSPNNKASLSHNRVYQLFEDAQHQLWIATDGGISLYQANKDQFIQIKHDATQPTSLSHNRVLSIAQDRGGMIWFGTLAGLNQWNPYSSAFMHLRNIASEKSSLKTNTVYSLAELDEERILIGTFGGGLNLFDRRSGEVAHITSNDTISATRIMTILSTSDDQIWIGSIAHGVEVLSNDLKKLMHFKNEQEEETSLSANGVTDIIQDSQKNIWVATYRAGLNLFNEKTQSFERFNLELSQNIGLKSNSIYQLMEDDEGYIWLATDGAGLARFDRVDRQFEHIVADASNHQSLSGQIISAIYQDSRGRFWIGTQGNGLNRWEPEYRRRMENHMQHYGVEDGLNSSTVNGILEDDEGNIWISTNRGVNKLEPTTNKMISFNLADELHYNELNQSAVLKLSDGQLLFGGLNGVSGFYPNKIKRNPYAPPVVLTSVMSGNEKLDFDQPLDKIQSLTFDHNDYLIALEFAALDYSKPSKNQYQYFLEGFDNDWISIGSRNRVVFTNLPNGNYRLHVKGSNSHGVWSEKSLRIDLRVLPAPWFSWWAYTFYGVSFCLLVLLLIRIQARRLAIKAGYHSRVAEEVAEKTSLYEKNTEFLKQQVEFIQQKSNFDIDSGLPKQSYLMDMVVTLTHALSQQKVQGQQAHFLLLLMRLPEIESASNLSEYSHAKWIKNIAASIREFDNTAICVRWNQREIGIFLQLRDKQLADGAQQDTIQRIMEIVTQVIDLAYCEKERLSIQVKQKVKVSYITLPLEGVSQNVLDGEKSLMLCEHLLYLISQHPHYDTVGTIKLNQIINTTLVNQLLSADELDEFERVFTMHKGHA